MSGGKNFVFFCSNKNVVVEANLAFTFSEGMYSLLPLPPGDNAYVEQYVRLPCVCDVLLQEEFTAHDESVNCVAFGQKSGQILVTGGEDKKVNFWAVGQKKCLLVNYFL